MLDLLAPKQIRFILESTKKVNLAHGSVRTGKTIANVFRFLHACNECPDSQIWMIGHTSSTIYDNAIRLILEKGPEDKPDPLAIFRPFCNWRRGERELLFKDKVISTVGAKDSGAIGAIQGKTMSLVYCDELTLYPESIIDMIMTRLSNPHSKLFASMNPSHPSHKCKQWIDRAADGDPNFYQLHFTLEDNPYVSDDYKKMIRESLSGVFYKRNYLGLWCLAEGSIFDFFDRSVYVVNRPPRAAEYWIVGIDYGTNNAFAAVLIGINTGQAIQDKPMYWVEDELYWDSKKTFQQKTNSEYVEMLKKWLEPYAVKNYYIDPSAASFKTEMRRAGMHPVDADNDVVQGIEKVIDVMKRGRLFVLNKCSNLIREIEGYVWDDKKSEKGEDAPMKVNDHAIDALRYAIYTHKVSVWNNEAHMKNQERYWKERYWRDGGAFR